ncbi:Trigger factor-like protein TIG, Chloroplastic, partial [Mucuna pruriens]
MTVKLVWIFNSLHRGYIACRGATIDSDIDAHRSSEKEFRRRYKSIDSLKVGTDRGLLVGDVAVLDISATTIDQDESNVKNIPSAESKGPMMCLKDDNELIKDGDKVLPGFLDFRSGIHRAAGVSVKSEVHERIYLVHQKENITELIKQNLALGDIYRGENLQFATEDLIKEVEKSIAEFKRQNQEYDEDQVKEQVQEILEWLREHAEVRYKTR